MHHLPHSTVPLTLNLAGACVLAQGMKDGWFTEYSTMWPGMGMSLKVEEILLQKRSDFQVRTQATRSHSRLAHGSSASRGR